ncbi:MAG TPA: serine hydrolase, partial [Thermomicrobiales bacterium]
MPRRRARPGSLALVLIVAAVIVLAIARTAPRGSVTGTATARIPPPASATATPRPATLTPLPATATATIPRPTATTIPTAPTATAAPSLIRPTPPTQSPASTAPAATPGGNLTDDVQKIRARDLPATNSVTLIASDGREVHLDDTRAEYPASTVKLPIYLTLAHRISTGEVGVTWETPITVQPGDIVGGTGVLQNAPGSTHTVLDIAQLMIVESDNVAANILLGRLGGQDTSREHVQAGAAVVTDYLGTLGVR